MEQTRAEYYFELYTAEGAGALLYGLPDAKEKTFEDDWLDFKVGYPGGDNKQDKGKAWDKDKLREIFSEVLGAFSNAGGGVVVFGLEASKFNGIDAVNNRAPVPDVVRFANELREFRHNVTDPGVSKVQVKEVPREPGAKDGFVVCLIPEGIQKPYMSTAAKKPFYYRINDESVEPKLPMLRQLFNPQRIITGDVHLLLKSEDETKQTLNIVVTMRNSGLYSMEHMELVISSKFWELRDVGNVNSYVRAAHSITIEKSILHPQRFIETLMSCRQWSQPYSFIDLSFTLFMKDFQPLVATVSTTREMLAASKWIPLTGLR